LNKLSLAIRHEAWRDAEKQGLSPTQGQILTLLHTDAAQRPTDLADALGISLPTVSASVKALVDKGLVAKHRTAEDGRAAVLVLSAAGRREADRASLWPDFLAETVQTLSPDEQEVFFKALVKMIHALQERGQIPVMRMCVNCRYFQAHAHRSRPKHHCHLIDAPLDALQLRLDCPKQEQLSPEERAETWSAFVRRP
jgi:DNA-binding MarR family transcriptional regulator